MGKDHEDGREGKIRLKVLGYGLMLGLILGGLGGITIALLTGVQTWIVICLVLGTFGGVVLGLALSPQVSESKAERTEESRL